MSTNASDDHATATVEPSRFQTAPARPTPALATRQPTPGRVLVFALALVLATGLGAALRLYQLDAHSFWADELYTLEAITYDGPASPPWRGWSHWATLLSLHLTGADVAAAHWEEPWQWRSHGLTEFNARLGPALVGILAIPVLALLALPMLGGRGAIVLALLMAAAPWHVYWSQNARFYMPLFLAASAFLALYYYGSRTGSRPALIGAAGAFVIAYFHHAPAIFLAGVVILDWLIARWRGQPLRLGRVGNGLVIGAIGLCAVLLLMDMTLLSTSWQHLAEQPRSHGPAMLVAGTVYMAQAVLVTLAALTAWALIRRGDSRGWLLALAALVPLATLFYLTATDRIFVHTRYGFYAYFAYLALAAAGLVMISRPLARRYGAIFALAPTAVVLVALLQASYFYHSGGQGFRSMWGQAFAFVDERGQPGDPVLTNFMLAGFYYLEADPQRVTTFPDSPDDLDTRAAEAMAETGAAGVWLVTAPEAAQGRQAEAWIDEAAELVTYFDTRIEQPHSSVRVYWYEPAEASQR